MEDKKGRDFWGGPCWRMIHSFAATYQPHKERAFRTFMKCLTELLPCEVCSAHLKQNLLTFPMDTYLTNNEQLFFWTYTLHDLVNKFHNQHSPNEIPKISPPYDQEKSKYFKALSQACDSCKTY